MKLDVSSRVTMNDGRKIPMFGLGTYQAPPGQKTYDAIRYALKIGYRLIDTARLYENEEIVGKAIRDSGIPREEVFVTTKLWNSDHGYDSTLAAFDRSLRRLSLDYVDLYLIHWPVPGKRMESWKALEHLQKQGRCRSIGVSNYLVRHLEELLGVSDVVPAVNQVEFHPFLFQKSLLEYCRDKEIQLEAYSPLTKGQRLNDPGIKRIAAAYFKSPAQIMIRWGLQHEVVEIPKSTNEERISENARIFDFEISREDMAALDAMDESLHTGWDPEDLP